MQRENPAWMGLLPTIRLCTNYKEDIDASVTQMVYGSTLTLAEEFLMTENKFITHFK